jgi:gag-polypeptide of LTR copia-type
MASTASTLTGSSTGDTSILVIIFSGKKDDWENWKENFIVRGSICGYHDILLGSKAVPETHKEDGTKETLSTTDQEIAMYNIKGFGDLNLSIDTSTLAGKVSFAMIKNTKTKKNPEGNLRTAYLRLKNKYEPNTTPHLMHLTREFHSKSLGKNQDPDMFITDLESLQIQCADLDHKIDDKALIIHVLNNLNNNYEMEVKLLEHKIQILKEANKELTIEEV